MVRVVLRSHFRDELRLYPTHQSARNSRTLIEITVAESNAAFWALIRDLIRLRKPGRKITLNQQRELEMKDVSEDKRTFDDRE